MYRSIDDYKSELINMYNNAPKTDETKSDTAYGYLTVVLTTQQGTYPLSGGSITVKSTAGKTLYSLLSDQNGKSEKMQLESVPKSNSENPENSASVAMYYDIFVTADGFIPIVLEGVPVFEGVNSVQRVDMIFSATAESTEVQTISFFNENTL